MGFDLLAGICACVLGALHRLREILPLGISHVFHDVAGEPVFNAIFFVGKRVELVRVTCYLVFVHVSPP